MSIQQMRDILTRILYYSLWAAAAALFCKFMLPVLAPFLLGFAIAVLLQPPVRWFQRHTGAKRPRTAVLVMGLFYLAIAAVLALLALRCLLWLQAGLAMLPDLYRRFVLPALRQAQAMLQLLANRLTPVFAPIILGANETVSGALGQLVNEISARAMAGLASTAACLPGFFLRAGLCILSSFFFAADYENISLFLARSLPKSWHTVLLFIKSEGLRTLLRMGRAYLALMLLTFGQMWLGLSLLRVPRALTLALITALVDILPVLGSGAVLVPWAAVQLLIGQWPLGAGLLLLYAIITVVHQILEPRLVGGQLGLHPLATLLAMYAGARWLGFAGLVGGPVLLTVAVQLYRGLHPTTGRKKS